MNATLITQGTRCKSQLHAMQIKYGNAGCPEHSRKKRMLTQNKRMVRDGVVVYFGVVAVGWFLYDSHEPLRGVRLSSHDRVGAWFRSQ